MIKLKIRKSKLEKNFKLPLFDEEEGEFDRYNFSEEEKNSFRNQFLEKNLKPLSDKIWSQLNNTDSWDEQSKNMEYVEKIAKQEEKDLPSIIDGIKSGSIPAPIVLQKDGKYELIGGNTRLMAARALKIRPRVLMIKS